MVGLMQEPPALIEERAYAAEVDDSRTKKEQALRLRVQQLARARELMFGPVTQQVTTWTEDGTTTEQRPIGPPETRITDTPGAHGVYSPSWKDVRLAEKDVQSDDPERWNRLLNDTTAHEAGHYFAHAVHGQPQGHNENWEAEVDLLKEAYGRAMVRAADEAAGVEYPEPRGLLQR